MNWWVVFWIRTKLIISENQTKQLQKQWYFGNLDLSIQWSKILNYNMWKQKYCCKYLVLFGWYFWHNLWMHNISMGDIWKKIDISFMLQLKLSTKFFWFITMFFFMMKPFSPYEWFLSQRPHAMHRAPWLTQWLDEDKNENEKEISTSSLKHQLRECFSEEHQ